MGRRGNLRLLRPPTSSAPPTEYSAIIVAFVAALVLWLPILVRRGLVFERDPSFYASTSADAAWSMGGYTLHGGISNIASQGIFYEPYAVVIWLTSHLGLPVSAAFYSKMIPLIMTMVAAGTTYILARHFGAHNLGAVLASLFYVLNPWSLEYFGYFFDWTGYCLIPVLILGTTRIREGGNTPTWLPLGILFLGGFDSWALAAIICTVTLLSVSVTNGRNVLSAAVKLGIVFLLTGAYWVVIYLYSILFPSNSSVLAYPSSGSPLQSQHPVTNLLLLRGFWWPHLNLYNYAGLYPLAIGALAAAVLTVAAITSVALNSSDSLGGDLPPYHRRLLGSLLVIGFILGAGTAGATGWAYKAIRSWPFAGSAIIRGFTREPARLASPFVAAIALALAILVTSLSRGGLWSHNSPNPWHSIRERIFITVLFLSVILASVPSLVTFWDTYRPSQLPNSYNQLANKVPKGVSLVIGYWPISAISPSNKTWQYVWSSREAADPSLLASLVGAPSISVAEPSAGSFDGSEQSDWSSAGSVAGLVSIARRTGVRSLVVEQDVRMSVRARARINHFERLLRQAGLVEEKSRFESIFLVPGQVRAPIWGNSCAVNDRWFIFGVVEIRCKGPTPRNSALTLVSPFKLPSPVLESGITVTESSMSGSIGTRLNIVHGKSGWILFLPNLLVVLGGLLTATYAVLVIWRALRNCLRSRELLPR